MSTSVFVEIKNYREILDAVDVIKSRLIVAKELLHQIHDIRVAENKEMLVCRRQLQEVGAVLHRLEEEVFSA